MSINGRPGALTCHKSGQARDAHEIAGHRGGVAELSAMYDRLICLIAARPGAVVIPTRNGQVEQAYQDVLSALS